MTEHARTSIRGSSLLLSGRVLAIGLSSIAQILIVRHLTAAEYGSWAYILSIVTILQTGATLGLDRAAARFIAFYYERQDQRRLVGVLLLLVGAIAAACVAIAFAVIAFGPRIGALAPLPLLATLLLLVPVQAFDALMAAVFGCVGEARQIFRSRHVAAPVLKIAAIAFAMLFDAGIVAFAYAYVAAHVLSVLLYVSPFVRLARQTGMFTTDGRVTIPVRELLVFSTPLLIVDISTALMQSAGALLLAHLADMRQVAIFAAVIPLAHLNQAVMRSFALLYTSSTSRLYARNDLAAINDLYWRTAIWMAVLSFPVFAVTFAGATELSVLLFGETYRTAGVVLALLAFGEYINVALGFNGLTLRVLNRGTYLIAITTVAAVITVALHGVLIPRYGAVGAGIAAASGMVVHNILKQMGLRLATGVSLFDGRYRSLYAAIATATVLLVAVRVFAPPNPTLVIGLACAIALGLLVAGRRALRVAEIFPEVRRVPLLRALLA